MRKKHFHYLLSITRFILFDYRLKMRSFFEKHTKSTKIIFEKFLLAFWTKHFYRSIEPFSLLWHFLSNFKKWVVLEKSRQQDGLNIQSINAFIYSLGDYMNFSKTRFCSISFENEFQRIFALNLKYTTLWGSILCFV